MGTPDSSGNALRPLLLANINAKQPEVPSTPPSQRRAPISLATNLSATGEIGGNHRTEKHGASTLNQSPVPLTIPRKPATQGRLPLRVKERLEQLEADVRARHKMVTAAAKSFEGALPTPENAHESKWANRIKAGAEALLMGLLNESVDDNQQSGTGGDVAPPAPPAQAAKSNPAPPARVAEPITSQAPKQTQGGLTAKKATAPQQPHQTPPDTTNQWTMVGSKKTNKAAPQANTPAARQQKQQPAQDDRVFLRLPANSALKQRTPAEIKVFLTEGTGLRLADIAQVQQTRTGFAIRAADKETRARLLAPWPFLDNQGAYMEKPEVWTTYVVQDVPKFLRNHNSVRETKDLIRDEVEAAAKRPPVACKMSHHQPEDAPTADWTISFTSPVQSGFKIFDSKPARKLERKTQITQCDRCLDYHDPRACTRNEKCRNCGKDKAQCTQPCNRPPKCANCNGPHRTIWEGCAARPKRKDGEVHRHSKAQLQAIRELGEKEYVEAHRTPADKARGGSGRKEPRDQPQPQPLPQPQTQPGEPPANPPAPPPSMTGSVHAPQHTPASRTREPHRTDRRGRDARSLSPDRQPPRAPSAGPSRAKTPPTNLAIQTDVPKAILWGSAAEMSAMREAAARKAAMDNRPDPGVIPSQPPSEIREGEAYTDEITMSGL